MGCQYHSLTPLDEVAVGLVTLTHFRIGNELVAKVVLVQKKSYICMPSCMITCLALYFYKVKSYIYMNDNDILYMLSYLFITNYYYYIPSIIVVYTPVQNVYCTPHE